MLLNVEEAAVAFEHMHPQLGDDPDVRDEGPQRLGDVQNRNIDEDERNEQLMLDGNEGNDVQGL